MAASPVKEALTDSTFTCSLASLADSGARQSTPVDNTTNLFLDALVVLKVKTGASGVSTTGYIEVRVFGSVDGGTTYTEAAGAADAGITLTSPPNAPLIGWFNANVSATSYVAGPFSVAAAFGGTLPDKWGIIVVNHTGHALDTTEGNHAKLWTGVSATVG